MSTQGKAKTYRIRQLPCILTYPRQVASFLAGIVPDLAIEDVKVFSLATSLNPLEIPSTKVATLMFECVPPIFDDGGTHCVIPGQSAGLVKDILVDVHFQDFTPLNDVPQDEHVSDCIAVSGLASHPFGSWKQRGSHATFMWLRDRLPREIPQVRSIIYGYDTALVGSESVKGVDDIAIALISKMKSIGRSSASSKLLIILAHSLGGIVVKQAMITMARTGDSTNGMLDSIRGVVFFGVPNQGMKVSHLLPMVEEQPNAHIVKLLSTESDYLQSLDRQFSGIVAHRQVKIMSVYETKRSATTQKTASGQWRRDGPKDLLVDRLSAIQQSSSLYIPVDEDHSNLVKFGADDQDCQAIINFMNDIAATFTSQSAKSAKTPSGFNEQRNTDSENELIDGMLDSLYIEETGLRLNDIQAQYESTFEWIFDNESLGFAKWLRGPGKLYWISGKPGSGKSTIMKLVRQDHRTRHFFTEDTSNGCHVMIDFFFHDRGSSIQKSIEGMLSRMLYQLLDTTFGPQFIKLILPLFASRLPQGRSRSNQRLYIWSLDDLRQALDIVLTQSHVPMRLLVFLDALDEFDGEPQIIADFVKDLIRTRTGSCTEIKICCSSRPWNVFRDSFSDLAGCQVHEYTQEDIRTYINGRFESNPRMRETIALGMRDGKNTVQTLKDILKERAEGVFVWVKLVLDELLKAYTEGAMPDELIDLLSSIPADLDKTYQRLIDRIPQEYRYESYIFIEVVSRNKYAFGLRDLGLTLLCALGASPTDSGKKLPPNHFSPDFLAATRRRLQSRCGGMLEVLGDSTVQFMHQTAKEFFGRPGSTEAILRHKPKLCKENGFSFLLKFYLTLVSVRSKGFDWLAYVLSMFRRLNYYSMESSEYRYKIATKINTKMVSRVMDCSTSTDSFHYLMKYAGFAPMAVKEHCLSVAYLSELSTGRSQREFLRQTDDEAIRRLFPPFRRLSRWDPSEPTSNSVPSFARLAGLRLFLEEVEEAGSHRQRRTPRREAERQAYHEPRSSSSNSRFERTRPPAQQRRAFPERATNLYQPYSQPYYSYAGGRMAEEQAPRYYSPGPNFYRSYSESDILEPD